MGTIPEVMEENTAKTYGRKMIGKSYSGKLNVRFDEGVLEIEYGWASEALSTGRDRNRYAQPAATTPGLHSTVEPGEKGPQRK